ncbi:FAD binding domain-containing protein [Colletotrichum phormii]|uniref:FAD binding domain-containing protein n=1 Tax=Colletotrichum phormii TaxID=359342 RepID=A0AAI9ZLN7_9PEZI|nr:FAD binding domain-containing protein [Colletotrichum phormii]KAK1634204.1 FAD binding domain-containing protein [Colletotrichum phormii]
MLTSRATSFTARHHSAHLRVAILCHPKTRSFHATYSVKSSQKHDRIVVGAGIAGVCTSIAAAEKGARVLLLDDAHGGGASALSGGVVYAGGGTRQQKEVGYGHDTPENMLAYLKEETGDAVDEKTLLRFCDESVARLDWLEKHGGRFEASLCPYKTSYPTNKHYLYFSGNEKSYPFNKLSTPAPRGHRMVQPGFSGSALWQALFDSAIRLGGDFKPASKVRQVLFNEKKDKVGGVDIKTLPDTNSLFQKHKGLTQKTKKFQIMASQLADVYHRKADKIWQEQSTLQTIHSGAVALSAGGFAFNPEMRQKHLPEFSKVAPLGTNGDDGSGIKIGQAAGGSVSNMNNMSAWRFLYPPTALLEGVVVSQAGERMGAEDVYGAALSDTMIRQHVKAKKQVFRQTDMPLLIQRLHWLYWGYKKAGSLAALASTFGISADGLGSTIQIYNDAIASGMENPMHKEADYCSPVIKAPFFGVDISCRTEGIQAVNGLTLGGLRVDGETGLVLTEDGSKIDGLLLADSDKHEPVLPVLMARGHEVDGIEMCRSATHGAAGYCPTNHRAMTGAMPAENWEVERQMSDNRRNIKEETPTGYSKPLAIGRLSTTNLHNGMQHQISALRPCLAEETQACDTKLRRGRQGHKGLTLWRALRSQFHESEVLLVVKDHGGLPSGKWVTESSAAAQYISHLRCLHLSLSSQSETAGSFYDVSNRSFKEPFEQQQPSDLTKTTTF